MQRRPGRPPGRLILRAARHPPACRVWWALRSRPPRAPQLLSKRRRYPWQRATSPRASLRLGSPPLRLRTGRPRTGYSTVPLPLRLWLVGSTRIQPPMRPPPPSPTPHYRPQPTRRPHQRRAQIILGSRVTPAFPHRPRHLCWFPQRQAQVWRPATSTSPRRRAAPASPSAGPASLGPVPSPRPLMGHLGEAPLLRSRSSRPHSDPAALGC